MPNPLLDMVNGGQSSAASFPMPNAGTPQERSGNPLLDMIAQGADLGGNAPPPSMVLPQSAQPKAPAAQAEAPSAWDQITRQIGLTARAGINGSMAITGMVADAATGIYNAGADALAGKGNGFRFQTTQSALNNLESRLGLPQPQNSTERVVQDATAGMAGVGGMNAVGQMAGKATNTAAQKIGEMLVARPLVTTLSGATGPGAASVVGESGGGPGAQLAAALVGSVVPTMAADGTAATVRAFAGNPSAKDLNQALSDFKAAGITPTVGQATQSRLARALESTLSKVPGGAGPMVSKAEDTASKVGTTIGDIADSLAPNADATSAGMAIARGVKGDDPASFVNAFRTTQEQLYNKLDQFIPAAAPVSVANTKQALADLNADISGAQAVSQFFKNGKILDLQRALEADTAGSPASVQVYSQPAKAGGGLMNAPVPQEPIQVQIPPGPATNTLPFEAVKKLRTLVGQQLTDSNILSDVPRSKWSRLYRGLSEDIGQAAQGAGPKAEFAWQRANDYTRAGMERLGLLESVVGQQIPERIFNAATSGAKDGGTMLRAVLKSIPEGAQKEVTAAFLNRMGQALPGAQNDTGTAFSLQTFLSNWARLSPQAKQALFNRPGYDADFASNLDKIARVASNLREGSKVFANPSGTAQVLTTSGAVGSALASLFTGHPGGAALIFGGAAGANVVARWMTNPNAVRWLAQAASMPSALLPSAINTLSQEASKSSDPQFKAFAAEVMKEKPTKPSLRQTISDAMGEQTRAQLATQ